MIDSLKALRDTGNSIMVVEHDKDMMLEADYIVDVGPGAGIHGGNVVFSGSVEELKNCTESITSDYLTGRKKIPVPENRRKGNGNFLTIKGATQNNLKKINDTLGRITEGDLNVTVDVRDNEEFASLSDDINSTVATLKNYIDEAAARLDKDLEMQFFKLLNI